jgi:tetratricopeptide (TPR) repeat protein
MPTLRLTQFAESQPDHYRVEVALEGDGLPRQIATARFNFKLSEQDAEDLRWYLEDFLQYPLDPAPTIAARVEARLAEIGVGLFKAVFQAGDDARDLWATLRDRLDDTRVEIITDVRQAAAIPWELIRDPKTDTPLALRAQAFVRAQPNPAQRPSLPSHPSTAPLRGSAQDAERVRILLVICRPGGREDVPFRSVASRLLKGLGDEARDLFQLDVLRPPSFEQLGKTLREAKARGEPYHILHFDGHGAYIETPEEVSAADILRRLMPLMLSGPRQGSHGYLLFENAKAQDNVELVDGPTLGKLLVETDVPVLVLNACRSAHAEAENPKSQTPKPQEASPNNQLPITDSPDDAHAMVRAFGSLAQEVMDAGVAGVVAMRYNVYVVTAAQFVADLYAALAGGQSLGEAVTMGRKQLAAQPLREIAFEPRPLQDWPVPVVYEAAPINLFPKTQGRAQGSPLQISLTSNVHASRQISNLPTPDIGFFGRDETLLALDRAFDTQRVVLLHAYAGSGKTTTAAEFARWYAITGGLEGPILFTSFEAYKPLARVLDTIGQVFGEALEGAGVHWLALDDAQRRQVALQVLAQIPVLWVWDNVEPVAGFPAGTTSAWSVAEQKELKDFLLAARNTKAKFLLTSRRDERGWLGELPARLTLPPMPMQERVQLARALAEKHGRRLTDVDDWRPLLQFTQGNPLTITVLVGQALREGRKKRAEIEAFVARLRAGEAAFDDEASEGRSKSLGASLGYGFASAFNEDERKQLALLHFFQGFVNVATLLLMDHPENPARLPEVRGLTREAGIALLDRAAEIGLLTAHGGGYYSIHPALPWYFKSLFEEYYSDQLSVKSEQSPLTTVHSSPFTVSSSLITATRAFVEALGELGSYYHNEYGAGNRDVISALAAEEANLLHARQLARTHGWWPRVISTMQGLRQLYDHTGRRAEWARLVNEIAPDFVDPATDGPLPGREDDWSLVTEYRVRLAMEARQWAEAERLQRTRVEWERRRAAPALALPPESLDGSQRNAIRSLAVSVEELGHILREQGKPECVAAYEEAIPFYQRIGNRPAEAVTAFNLGHAYMTLPALRDLAQAERWYRRSLEMYEEHQQHDRAQCLGQLGLVARERFKEARAANKPEEELLQHLNAALQFYQQALALLPPNAVDDLAVTHGSLGNIYSDAGDLENALRHWREAARYFESANNTYYAAQTRCNIAIALANAGRLADAREYAYAALRNFETYGERAAEEIQKTRRVIEMIEEAMKGGNG